MSRWRPLIFALLLASAGGVSIGLLLAQAAPAVEVSGAIYEFAPRFCSYTNARVLAAGLAETITFPAGKDLVFLTYDTGLLYVNKNGTAVAPSGDVTDGSASELILSGSTRRVTPAGTLSIVNTSNAKVTECYSTAIRRVGTQP